MEASSQLPIKVYRSRAVRMLVIFLSLLYMFLIFDFAALTIESFHDLEAIAVIVSMFFLISLFAYGTLPLWNLHIEITPEGIIYHNPTFYRIYTPWHNITSIEKAKYPIKLRHTRSFILREPATRLIPFSEGRQRQIPVIEKRSLLVRKAELVGYCRAIPCGWLIPADDMQFYLQRYAPHVLEDIAERSRQIP